MLYAGVFGRVESYKSWCMNCWFPQFAGSLSVSDPSVANVDGSKIDLKMVCILKWVFQWTFMIKRFVYVWYACIILTCYHGYLEPCKLKHEYLESVWLPQRCTILNLILGCHGYPVDIISIIGCHGYCALVLVVNL